MNRARKLKLALWMAAGLAASVAATRFLFGLGTTTNLSDANPWGVWIGFDVMAGVALAAGGFIIAASVYIFKLDRFHPIVRPAVLTAFLGYVAVAVSLLFDLGLPWNIWHMIVFWNPHSPLFEVGWCVMLYLTVLALEFFPVPAEEFSGLAKVRRFLIKARLPLVIVGIGLSTLHQSSLGSLFLIMPYRLHPLWYSPILPLLFPDFRYRPGVDDGNVRKPSHRLSLPPQAGNRPAGVACGRNAVGAAVVRGGSFGRSGHKASGHPPGRRGMANRAVLD